MGTNLYYIILCLKYILFKWENTIKLPESLTELRKNCVWWTPANDYMKQEMFNQLQCIMGKTSL